MTPEDMTYRSDFIAGLRAAADFLETHEMVPVPEPSTDGIAIEIVDGLHKMIPGYGGGDELVSRAAQYMAPCETVAGRHLLTIQRRFGPVSVGVYVARSNLTAVAATA